MTTRTHLADSKIQASIMRSVLVDRSVTAEGIAYGEEVSPVYTRSLGGYEVRVTRFSLD